MDEKRGRKAAQAAGLEVAGTLAVILQGARQGLFDGKAMIAKLTATNFYAAPELMEQIHEILDAGSHPS